MSDPRDQPFAFAPRADNPIRRAVERLVGPHDYVLITSRATSPHSVKGSAVGAECAACHELVWVAPSSQPLLGKATVVCTHCLAGALRAIAN